MIHNAERALPVPVNITKLQPAIDEPLSVNATVPVGEAPDTVAIRVTWPPAVDGFGVAVTVVVDGVGQGDDI